MHRNGEIQEENEDNVSLQEPPNDVGIQDISEVNEHLFFVILDIEMDCTTGQRSRNHYSGS